MVRGMYNPGISKEYEIVQFSQVTAEAKEKLQLDISI